MIKQLLIASIAIAYVVSQSMGCSTRNCATCENKKCTRCYNSMVDSLNQCAPTETLQTMNCALYGLGGECLMCKPGYALRMKGSGVQQQGFIQCVFLKNPIENCISAKQTPQGFNFCEMCQGGYPSFDGSHCRYWNAGLQTGLQ